LRWSLDEKALAWFLERIYYVQETSATRRVSAPEDQIIAVEKITITHGIASLSAVAPKFFSPSCKKLGERPHRRKKKNMGLTSSWKSRLA